MIKINIKLFVILILIIASCNKKSELLEDNININEPKIIGFKFPDTVSKNQETLGELKYNLKIDTLESSDIIERYTLFYITTEKNAIGVEAIEKTEHNIFLDTIGNGTFKFKVKFANTGNQLLSGVVEDVVMFKGEKKDKILTITDETSVMWEVFVKD